MDKYGLIGYPLEHSFSEGYFNEKFQNEGIDAEYNNYEISWRGDVVNICKKQKVNIKDNLFFFKNIKKIDYMICPYKECNCDGLLKIYKERV